MRLNQFIAQATGLSRRAADKTIQEGRVRINGQTATVGQVVDPGDKVSLDGRAITPAVKTITIMLNKPVGYVVSRDGQGSPTVYDLLPPEYAALKPVGRLDKASSGLLLLTNDGQLANQLTHPRYAKEKVYEVGLDRPLTGSDKLTLAQGIRLEDGLSRLQIEPRQTDYVVRLHEGRNRQIRRTFAALGYTVNTLHRTQFGNYSLDSLRPGKFRAA